MWNFVFMFMPRAFWLFDFFSFIFTTIPYLGEIFEWNKNWEALSDRLTAIESSQVSLFKISYCCPSRGIAPFRKALCLFPVSGICCSKMKKENGNSSFIFWDTRFWCGITVANLTGKIKWNRFFFFLFLIRKTIRTDTPFNLAAGDPTRYTAKPA